jgi:hypothetical protein
MIMIRETPAIRTPCESACPGVYVFHNGDWDTRNWLELCLPGGMVFELVDGTEKFQPPTLNCGFAILREDATYYVLCVDPAFVAGFRVKDNEPKMTYDLVDWQPVPHN